VFNGFYDSVVGLWGQVMFIINENKNEKIDPQESVKACLYFFGQILDFVVILSLVYFGSLLGAKHS
jgi:hypothetical protein